MGAFDGYRVPHYGIVPKYTSGPKHGAAKAPKRMTEQSDDDVLRDAERYRSIRQAVVTQDPQWMEAMAGKCADSESEFDAAIDAAIAGEKAKVNMP